MIRSFFAKEDGQGLVEYALILVLMPSLLLYYLPCRAARSPVSAQSTTPD